MITGGIDDFNNKNEFINYLNISFGNIFNFKQVGVKKSSNLCICDSISSNSRKYKLAKLSDIPIISSRELLSKLQKGSFEV